MAGEGGAVFSADASQWPLAARQIQQSAGQIAAALAQVDRSGRTTRGTADFDRSLNRLQGSLSSARGTIPRHVDAINAAIASAGKGGTVSGLGQLAQSVETQLAQAKRAMDRFGRDLGRLGIGRDVAAPIIRQFSEDFAAATQAASAAGYGALNRAKIANKTKLGNTLAPGSNATPEQRAGVLSNSANRAYARTLALQERAIANQGTIGRTFTENAAAIEKAFSGVRRALAPISADSILPRRTVVDVQQRAAAVAALRDTLFGAAAGPKGGLPRTTPEFVRRLGAAESSRAVARSAALIPQPDLDSRIQDALRAQRRALATPSPVNPLRVQGESLTQLSAFRSNSLANNERELKSFLDRELNPFRGLLARRTPPPAVGREELGAVRRREVAATKDLAAAESALANARNAGPGSVQLRQTAEATRSLQRAEAALREEETPARRRRVASAQDRVAALADRDVASPAIRAAERRVTSTEGRLGEVSLERQSLEGQARAYQVYRDQLSNTASALADQNNLTTPANRQFAAALSARATSLNAEQNLSRASIEAQRRANLEQFHGGGSGGGGIGGGPAPGSSPFDAFLGGLTSKGFNSKGGFQPDLLGISATAGTLTKYAALSTVLYGTAQAFGTAKVEVLDYVDSLTDLATALDTGTGDFGDLRQRIDDEVVPSLQRLSRLSGANVGASLDVASRGVRAFTSPDDAPERRQKVAIGAARVANELAVITGGDLPGIAGNVVAIGSAFGYAGEQLGLISDVIANSRTFGGDLNETTQGLSNFAQAASVAGISAQEAANLISVVQAKTDQSGQTVATRLSRITQIFNTAANQDVLKRFGVDTSSGFLEQLAALQKAFDSQGTSEGVQKSITSKLGGTANVREFTVALAEADRVINGADDSLRKAGSGADLFAKKSNDLAGLFRKISGDIKNIIINLQRSDLGALLGVGLIVLEKMLFVTSELIGLFAGLPGPLTKALVVAAQLYGIFKAISFITGKAAAKNVLGVTSLAPSALERGAIIGSPGSARRIGKGAAGLASPAYAAEAVALRTLTEARLLDNVVSTQSIELDIALTRSSIAAAKATLAEQQAVNRSSLSTQELARRKIILVEANIALSQSERVLIAQTATLTELQATGAAVTAAYTARLNELALANDRAAASASAAGAAGAAGGGGILGRRRAAAAAEGGAPAAGGLGLVSKVFIAAAVAYAAITIADGIKGAIGSGRAAGAGARDAQTSFFGATDNAEEQRAIEQERAVGQQFKKSAGGIFGSIADAFESFNGGPKRGARGQSLLDEATVRQGELDDRIAAQRKAAIKGDDPLAVFQDLTLEGLQAAFESLERSGAGAKESLDLFARALGGADRNLEEGFVLPGTLDRVTKKIIAPFADPRQDAIAGVLGTGVINRLTGVDPRDLKLRREREKLSAQLGDLRVSPTKQRSGEIDRVLKDEIGPVEVGRRSVLRGFSDQDAKSLNEAREKALADFFAERGLTQDQGGLLQPKDIETLADKLTQTYVSALGLSPEEQAATIAELRTLFRDNLRSALTPGAIIRGDQGSSNLAQQFVVGQSQRLDELKFGDADALKQGRRNEGVYQTRLDQIGPQRSDFVILPAEQLRGELQNRIGVEQQRQAQALRPLGEIEVARKKLNAILAIETEAMRADTAVSTATIQAELQARSDLADSIQEGREARLANQGYSEDPVQQASTDLKVLLSRRKFLARKKAGDFEALGAGEGLEDLKAGVKVVDFAETGKTSADEIVAGFTSLNYSIIGQSVGASLAGGVVAGASGVLGAALGSLDAAAAATRAAAVPLAVAPGAAKAAGSQALQDVFNKGASSDAAAAAHRAQLGAVDAKKKNDVDVAYENNELAIKRAQTALKGAGGGGKSPAEQASRALELAQAKLAATVDPRSSISAIVVQIKSAKLALANHNKGEPEYYQALAELRKAQFDLGQAVLDRAAALRSSKRLPGDALGRAADAVKDAAARRDATAPKTVERYQAVADVSAAKAALADATAQRDSAKRASQIFSGSELGDAVNGVKDAQAQLKNAAKFAGKNSAEYYQALTELHSAQAALTAAQLDAAKVAQLLSGDVTNPLQAAAADTRRAADQLAANRRAGASKDVLNQGELDVRQAQANEESVRFEERLKAAQTADSLGRISHAQYIKYLDNESHRLNDISNRTYQQQEQLDQIDGLLKDAQDAIAGQFNLADIQLPTAYEVRRFIKAQTSTLGAYTQGNATTVNIMVNGADTARVQQIMSQTLGPVATQSSTTAVRK